MTEKFKFKLPKLNLNLFKKKLLVIFGIVAVVFLLLDIMVLEIGRQAANQTKLLQEKKQRMKSANATITQLTAEKLYLQEEEFKRKIPFAAIPPVAAIQQAGIIISRNGAQNLITITEKDAEYYGSGRVSSRGGDVSAPSVDKGTILVGAKTLKKTEFTFKFTSTYNDFMRILEKLAIAEPLLMMRTFTLKRIDNDETGTQVSGTPFFALPEVSGDLRVLDIELTLFSFTEISPDEGIWSIGK